MGRSRPLHSKSLASRLAALRWAALSVLLLPAVAAAQATSFDLSADTISTWQTDEGNVVLVDGPVSIQVGDAKLTGRSAVVWFTTEPGSVLNRQRAGIALIGDVRLEQVLVIRTGERLFVSSVIAGPIRLTAERRNVEDASATDLFRAASALRPAAGIETALANETFVESSPEMVVRPGVIPVTPANRVSFRAADVDSSQKSSDGFVTVILRGGVLVIQRRPDGSLIELQADTAVLFTAVKDLRELETGERKRIEETITAAYLEGDVRLVYTPADLKTQSEQRLTSDRVYYEFATDRAITTAAVLHTTDPSKTLPVTLRANAVRQLAIGEYSADKVELSTSNFAAPSYALRADKTYIRTYSEDGDNRVDFEASGSTFRTFGVPVFYLPYVGGDLSTSAFPLRNFVLGSSRGFGFGVQSEFGLFESFGKAPPKGLDASYQLEYFTERGPAIGLDAKYRGGYVSDVERQPTSFEGEFTGYVVKDHGNDRLNRYRNQIPNDSDFGTEFGHPDYRGRLLWEHQHFTPDDWQIQLRAGLVSDNTFLEEWFENEFDTGLPHNLSAYFKRQRGSEALTFLLEFQPNNFITSAESLQERFPSDPGSATNVGDGLFGDTPFEIDRLPEIGYYRVGDALGDDAASESGLTFFSENRLSGLRMNEGGDTLQEYGFRGVNNNQGQDRFAFVGIPSYGYTGVTDNYVGRFDSRQEIDLPFDAGPMKFVPYVFGRYTGYTDGPQGDAENRLMAGTGVRVTTAFWNVDDSAKSTFFDVNRVRHVVEPEMHLFTSIASIDREDVYVFDEEIDGISDVSAASFWLRQRWQTKRGGPGRWRSVDFIQFNAGVNVFANTPSEPSTPDANAPTYDQARFGPIDASQFRGLFFNSMPEASLARTSLNADYLWRLSDTTTILGDTQYNLEKQALATTALGFAAQRGDRLTYYAGLRYIGQADSTIASFNANYSLTMKYQLLLNVAYDLNKTENQVYAATLLRRFDRFFATVGFFYDASEDESGFRFSVFPEGLGVGFDTEAFRNAGFGQ